MAHAKRAYCVDLDQGPLEIGLFEGKELAADLKRFKVSDPEDLTNPDRRVFKSFRKAETFLRKYKAVRRKLERIHGKTPMPAMLYKRRYLVLAAMGLKISTQRHYKKPWKSGQVFRFNDQTFCLEVKLTKITALGGGNYKYDYRLL